MPILHVRTVPEELYERIQERANSQRRSISAEMLSLLQDGLAANERPQAGIQIRQRRFDRAPNSDALPSTKLLREDRERSATSH